MVERSRYRRGYVAATTAALETDEISKAKEKRVLNIHAVFHAVDAPPALGHSHLRRIIDTSLHRSPQSRRLCVAILDVVVLHGGFFVRFTPMVYVGRSESERELHSLHFTGFLSLAGWPRTPPIRIPFLCTYRPSHAPSSDKLIRRIHRPGPCVVEAHGGVSCPGGARPLDLVSRFQQGLAGSAIWMDFRWDVTTIRKGWVQACQPTSPHIDPIWFQAHTTTHPRQETEPTHTCHGRPTSETHQAGPRKLRCGRRRRADANGTHMREALENEARRETRGAWAKTSKIIALGTDPERRKGGIRKRKKK